jgi:hypothetical protein
MPRSYSRSGANPSPSRRIRGALQVNEVLDHRFAERRELDHDACRQHPGLERKISTSEARRAAERSGDVPHRAEVAHLFNGHSHDHAPPARHGFALDLRQAFGLTVAQAERRI